MGFGWLWRSHGNKPGATPPVRHQTINPPRQGRRITVQPSLRLPSFVDTQDNVAYTETTDANISLRIAVE